MVPSSVGGFVRCGKRAREKKPVAFFLQCVTIVQDDFKNAPEIK